MSFLIGLLAWTRLKGNAFTVLRVLFFTWVKKIKFLPMRFFQSSSLTITGEHWHNQSILSFALDINNDIEKPHFQVASRSDWKTTHFMNRTQTRLPFPGVTFSLRKTDVSPRSGETSVFVSWARRKVCFRRLRHFRRFYSVRTSNDPASNEFETHVTCHALSRLNIHQASVSFSNWGRDL